MQAQFKQRRRRVWIGSFLAAAVALVAAWHTVASLPTSTCLSCHVPKRRTEDAVHVVMTDHFTRRTQPQRDLLAPIAEIPLPKGALRK